MIIPVYQNKYYYRCDTKDIKESRKAFEILREAYADKPQSPYNKGGLYDTFDKYIEKFDNRFGIGFICE